MSTPSSRGGIAFTVALLAFTMTLLLATAGLQESASVVPRLVGVPLALLLGWLLVRQLVARSRDRSTNAAAALRGEAAAVLWVLALPVLATMLGFVLGPALYVFAAARWRGRERPAIAAAAGAVTAAVILLVFGALLGVRLPRGLPGIPH